MAAEPFADVDAESGYPSALTTFDEDYMSGFMPRCIYELQILEIEASIKEKDEWWIKARDDKISTKWHQEVMEQLAEEGEAAAEVEYRKQLVTFAIAECKWLAEKYQAGPVRPAAVEGVFERNDLEESLRQKLVQGIAALRAKPAIGTSKEDRHPGTPQMVDLVHPSLYCYERGKSAVLPDVGAEAKEMPEWSTFLGKDGVTEKAEKTPKSRFYGLSSPTGLQWLPAEFVVSEDGKTCDIKSYINCLHPVQHAELHKSISELFCHALPALEEVLAEAGEHRAATKRYFASNSAADDKLRERQLRIGMEADWWEGEPREQKDDESDTAYDEYTEAWHEDESNKTFLKPEVPDFAPPEYTRERADVNLRGKPLQVIVKIASLELATGESFDGGTWHVEGTLQERIVATACYYLDCDNVTGAELGFRTSVSEPSYEQNDEEGVRRMYNLHDGGPLLQPAGSCQTRQGRVLAWPNTKQHRVHPVHLVDATKPGKRTICCFFLVDPKVRVRSTATVPPQQLAWVAESVNPALAAAGMGESALRAQVAGQLASTTLLTYEAACERRERLMAERRGPAEGTEPTPLVRPFSLCEH